MTADARRRPRKRRQGAAAAEAWSFSRRRAAETEDAGTPKGSRRFYFTRIWSDVSDNPRIAELRRRVDRDPTSIAFAQLAEEYRRIGDYPEAVKVCRDGLARHPGYTS